MTSHARLFWCAVALMLVSSVICSKITGSAAADANTIVPSGNAVHGKALYLANCASCHGATGTEGGLGPSLKHEGTRKNTLAAIAWIKNPTSPMPKLYPSPLSGKDVSDIAAYVEKL